MIHPLCPLFSILHQRYLYYTQTDSVALEVRCCSTTWCVCSCPYAASADGPACGYDLNQHLVSCWFALSLLLLLRFCLSRPVLLDCVWVLCFCVSVIWHWETSTSGESSVPTASLPCLHLQGSQFVSVRGSCNLAEETPIRRHDESDSAESRAKSWF